MHNYFNKTLTTSKTYHHHIPTNTDAYKFSVGKLV
jgi:hypothetical protein